MADEADTERVASENRATEEKGTAWQQRSDAFLVGYVSEMNRSGQFHTPAIVEMQRRQMVATRDFNAQSSAQTARVITLTENLERLTQRLFWLAVVQVAIAIAVGTIAAVQLWTMLKGGN